MAYDHGAFRVRNLDASIKFYTEKLGFRLLFRMDDGGAGDEIGAFLDYNGARLELLQTPKIEYTPAVPVRPYCPHLCFQTDDIEGVINRLKENGIELLDGPNEIPGSEIWIYFTDLDNNVLEFIHWIDANKK